ncbi:MAG: hypothetical protein JNM59_04295 [Hyphomonadaceae bacterium]|nr:hypothetical protein [Hyphomonadaceae bacterium]
MKQFGAISAWAAAVAGLLFLGFGLAALKLDITTGAMLVIGALLATGAVRTLRKLSGGLRLLAGAWGLAAGFMVLPFAQSGSLRGFYSDLGWAAYGMTALALACVIGLTLTVLHKEK